MAHWILNRAHYQEQKKHLCIRDAESPDRRRFGQTDTQTPNFADRVAASMARFHAVYPSIRAGVPLWVAFAHHWRITPYLAESIGRGNPLSPYCDDPDSIRQLTGICPASGIMAGLRPDAPPPKPPAIDLNGVHHHTAEIVYRVWFIERSNAREAARAANCSESTARTLVRKYTTALQRT